MDVILKHQNGWACSNSAEANYIVENYNPEANTMDKVDTIIVDNVFNVVGELNKGNVVQALTHSDSNGEYEVLSVIRGKATLKRIGELKQTESEIIKQIKKWQEYKVN